MFDAVQEILDKAIESALTKAGSSRIREMEIYGEYAEPGYEHTGLIVTGNWNDISKYEDGQSCVVDSQPSRVADLLEKAGVEIEWSDEWTGCSECNKLVRTSPNGYGWTPSYAIIDGAQLCHECIKEDPTEYLEYLAGDQANAVTIDIDLAEHDYRLLADDYQNGLYGGQAASPAKIKEALTALGVERAIFVIDSVGQFDLSFSVWIHTDEELDEEAFAKVDTDGTDPAVVMKKRLEMMV